MMLNLFLLEGLPSDKILRRNQRDPTSRMPVAAHFFSPIRPFTGVIPGTRP